jgi:hypothetical protein
MSKRMVVFFILWPILLVGIIFGGGVLLLKSKILKFPPAQLEEKKEERITIDYNDPKSIVMAFWEAQDKSKEMLDYAYGKLLFKDVLTPERFQRWINLGREIKRREIKKVEAIIPDRWKVYADLIPLQEGEPIRVVYLIVKIGGQLRIEEIQSQCSMCDGTGKVMCPNCGGTGRVEETREIKTTDEYGYEKYRTIVERVRCYQCNGKKKITCENCKGSGYIEVNPDQLYIGEDIGEVGE